MTEAYIQVFLFTNLSISKEKENGLIQLIIIANDIKIQSKHVEN